MSALIILVKMKTNITLATKKEIEAKNDINKKKKKTYNLIYRFHLYYMPLGFFTKLFTF